MYKPVLVTGASSGIGEAAAVLLARSGFKVYAAARRLEKTKDLEGLAGGRITALRLDVIDEGSIEQAMATIAEAGQPLYGLVNNAGVSVTGPVEEVDMNEWRRQFETNVFAVVAMCKAVAPQMRGEGRGRIVNVGSVAGRIVSPFMGAYAASKHALEGLSDALRQEMALHGVKVSLVRPGFINTPFGEQEQDGLEPFAEPGRPYADAVARMKAWHAKGHPDGASPMDVAEAIRHALTAANPKARYVVPKKYLGSLLLRNTLPEPLVDGLMGRIVGLQRK